MKRAGNLFHQITDFQNLYLAFKKAFKGTNRTDDSLSFYFNLEKELFVLKKELEAKTYQPGAYRHFKVFDPKERTISVAPFRDRVVHHAIVNILELIYEKRFIFDSYATRKEKGTHKAILRAQTFLRKNRWFLKADIEKYFENIDHDILLATLERKIKDRDALLLLERIIRNGGQNNKGLPIVNLTSQFLANVYFAPFDHFVKEELGERFYVRYMDDFVFFNKEKLHLKELCVKTEDYLREHLNLKLKERAVMINQRTHGLSFLGARVFPRLTRIKRESLKRCLKKFKERLNDMKKGKLSEERLRHSLDSIIGHLAFFNSQELTSSIFWGRCR